MKSHEKPFSSSKSDGMSRWYPMATAYLPNDPNEFWLVVWGGSPQSGTFFLFWIEFAFACHEVSTMQNLKKGSKFLCVGTVLGPVFNQP